MKSKVDKLNVEPCSCWSKKNKRCRKKIVVKKTKDNELNKKVKVIKSKRFNKTGNNVKDIEEKTASITNLATTIVLTAVDTK